MVAPWRRAINDPALTYDWRHISQVRLRSQLRPIHLDVLHLWCDQSIILIRVVRECTVVILTDPMITVSSHRWVRFITIGLILASFKSQSETARPVRDNSGSECLIISWEFMSIFIRWNESIDLFDGCWLSWVLFSFGYGAAQVSLLACVSWCSSIFATASSTFPLTRSLSGIRPRSLNLKATISQRLEWWISEILVPTASLVRGWDWPFFSEAVLVESLEFSLLHVLCLARTHFSWPTACSLHLKYFFQPLPLMSLSIHSVLSYTAWRSWIHQ